MLCRGDLGLMQISLQEISFLSKIQNRTSKKTWKKILLLYDKISEIFRNLNHSYDRSFIIFYVP